MHILKVITSAEILSNAEKMQQATSPKRGRPRLYPRLVDSYAVTGVIRKPYFLAKMSASRSTSYDGETDGNVVNLFPLMHTGITEPVAKLYISVEAFSMRGPKPGKKRNKYRKRKIKKARRAESEDEPDNTSEEDSDMDTWTDIPEKKDISS